MMPVKCWSSLSCVSRFSRSINLHFIPLNLIRRVLSASSTSAKVNAAISGRLICAVIGVRFTPESGHSEQSQIRPVLSFVFLK